MRVSDQSVTQRLYRDVLADFGRDAVAVDLGAGSGELTVELLQRFDVVHAVEPNESLREVLRERCPTARIIPSTIADAELPHGYDVAAIRHVLYHVPDHKWGGYVHRVASGLSPRGVLLVTLQHPDSPIYEVMEALHAPRFDLFSLERLFRRHSQWRVEQITTREEARLSSFDEACALVRFCLNDRDHDAYGRSLTDDAFREATRSHVWNRCGAAGVLSIPTVTYVIRPNPYW